MATAGPGNAQSNASNPATTGIGFPRRPAPHRVPGIGGPGIGNTQAEIRMANGFAISTKSNSKTINAARSEHRTAAMVPDRHLTSAPHDRNRRHRRDRPNTSRGAPVDNVHLRVSGRRKVSKRARTVIVGVAQLRGAEASSEMSCRPRGDRPGIAGRAAIVDRRQCARAVTGNNLPVYGLSPVFARRESSWTRLRILDTALETRPIRFAAAIPGCHAYRSSSHGSGY